MSTLPRTEALLLEIHQSLGCRGYQTTRKTKFATGQMSLKAYEEMGKEILHDILDALNLDPLAQKDAINNLMEFANAHKYLQQNTWTFAADQRQILWMMLTHFYVPSLARRVGFWSLEEVLDTGMPGGHFWYLPEPCEMDGKTCVSMPVTQVIDWLLDLLGMPLETFADQQSEARVNSDDSLRRSLYYWRSGTTIRPETINKHFSDEANLRFDGAISLCHNSPPSEQFLKVRDFVEKKGLTADKLRLEIPMTHPGRIEAILAGQADEDEQMTFVKHIAARYAPPQAKTIRQRLLLARMVQDGYVRLLKFLCPGVDRLSADPQQNKLLQLCALYKSVYNLTIAAWRNCAEQGENAENAWFEAHLPALGNLDVFLSILPSRREIANHVLAELLTDHFCRLEPEAMLEDHWGVDETSTASILQREMERTKTEVDEIKAIGFLIDRMSTSSPWRILQTEHRYSVVNKVVQRSTLSLPAREAAIKRLRELATTPSEMVQAILWEIDSYLNGENKQRPKDTMARVNALLNEAQSNSGYALWQAPLLQYKAKHLLASNDFDGAARLFREAMNATMVRNYGPLRGEIARDILAVELANQKLIPNNHETYYRAMMNAGMMAKCDVIPSIEETARWASNYFWHDLYKPYPGIKAEVPRVKSTIAQLFKQLWPLFQAGDHLGLQQWIKANRPLLKSNLPDVDGNSVLMMLIKIHSQFVQNIPMMKERVSREQQSEIDRFEAMLENWRVFIGQLAKESPKQLNIPDIKGQTPLMLIAEEGNTRLVALMLEAGANPEIQSNKGMTALHSAIKSGVDSCVDALLDNPCRLDHVTDDGRSPLHTAGWSANLHAVKRLLQLAPGLVWLRDAKGMTPLELVENMIEKPEVIRQLNNKQTQHGRRGVTRQALVVIANLLAQAALL
ncbi:ankyrin repeat domain-containing protein [Dickeya lacustris]|uniref:Ankyrin repeat domain-containing protein n=1 Tax=Dickeya lacustris TaxID=2259638 RepID=A0ABY8G557_9GAMM|nr:ankyrin repeat domain-containing protein [Dickeya lacustris]WFN55082.1 ankyrin repeat domain-containing protein [Dickeya lacustris]